MSRRLPLVGLLICASCFVHPDPIVTDLSAILHDSTVDAAGSVFATRRRGLDATEYASTIERYRVTEGRYELTGSYTFVNTEIMGIDATDRPNELWILHRPGGLTGAPKLERFRVKAFPFPMQSRLVRTAILDPAVYGEISQILDFSAGPDDTVYLTGFLNPNIARCQVRNGACTDLIVEQRRGDDDSPLQAPRFIEVDEATGDVYVVDGPPFLSNDPTRRTSLLTYEADLTPTHEPAIEVPHYQYWWMRPVAHEGYLILREDDRRRGAFLVYERLAATTEAPAGLYLRSRSLPAHDTTYASAGERLSSTCGYFAATARPTERGSSLVRYLFGSDCSAFD